MIDGIYEFTFRPIAKKGKASVVFFGALAIAAVLVIASVISPLYKGLISLAAVALMCSSLYIFQRYLSGEYAYVVAYGSEEEPIFIVTKTVGKRVSTLGNFYLADIISVDKEGKGERGAHKTAAGVIKYNYNPSLMPDTTYRLTLKSRWISAEIVLEGSDEFASRLREYASIARAHISNEEE